MVAHFVHEGRSIGTLKEPNDRFRLIVVPLDLLPYGLMKPMRKSTLIFRVLFGHFIVQFFEVFSCAALFAAYLV